MDMADEDSDVDLEQIKVQAKELLAAEILSQSLRELPKQIEQLMSSEKLGRDNLQIASTDGVITIVKKFSEFAFAKVVVLKPLQEMREMYVQSM